MITTFNGKQTGKHVVHIACGSTYSAAITADGELYTWGRGNYGRLGHGGSPNCITSLKCKNIISLMLVFPHLQKALWVFRLQ